MAPDKKKISCRDCKRTCCDDIKLILLKGQKGINPEKAKTGSWLFTVGITWVKKKNGLWKCRAFDSKKRLCRIYKYRPPLCRYFVCKWGKKKRLKNPLNETGRYGSSVYKIVFSWNGVNERPKENKKG